jgi:hypothetical protein
VLEDAADEAELGDADLADLADPDDLDDLVDPDGPTDQDGLADPDDPADPDDLEDVADADDAMDADEAMDADALEAQEPVAPGPTADAEDVPLFQTPAPPAQRPTGKPSVPSFDDILFGPAPGK